MSFILIPSEGDDLQINGWHWRPTLELIRTAGALTEEEYERMSAQGCGGYADAAKAKEIAEIVDAKLGEMKAGDRLRADLAVVSYSKPKSEPIEQADPNELYSASYDWLCRFRDFCRKSGGFRVV